MNISKKIEITASDEPAIREWLNCEVAEVDEDGDVWVQGPMQGHWLSDEKLEEYKAWRAQ